MANSGITIDDRAWFAAIKQVIADDKSAAVKQEHARALRVQAAARRYAPRAAIHDPSEPRLVDSIEVVDGVDEAGMPYSDVGTTVPHGVFQEYGTSKMEAHPYMRPAVEENLG